MQMWLGQAIKPSVLATIPSQLCISRSHSSIPPYRQEDSFDELVWGTQQVIKLLDTFSNGDDQD